MFILEIEGKTVGTIELGWSDKENRIMRFGRLLIDENYRGKGYGKILIQLIEEIAFNKYEASYLELGVFAYNQNAKMLYEKLGYEIVDTKIDLNDSSLNAYTMRKKR